MSSKWTKVVGRNPSDETAGAKIGALEDDEFVEDAACKTFGMVVFDLSLVRTDSLASTLLACEKDSVWSFVKGSNTLLYESVRAR